MLPNGVSTSTIKWPTCDISYCYPRFSASGRVADLRPFILLSVRCFRKRGRIASFHLAIYGNGASRRVADLRPFILLFSVRCFRKRGRIASFHLAIYGNGASQRVAELRAFILLFSVRCSGREAELRAFILLSMGMVLHEEWQTCELSSCYSRFSASLIVGRLATFHLAILGSVLPKRVSDLRLFILLSSYRCFLKERHTCDLFSCYSRFSASLMVGRLATFYSTSLDFLELYFVDDFLLAVADLSNCQTQLLREEKYFVRII
jgi:hypothetical protein